MSISSRAGLTYHPSLWWVSISNERFHGKTARLMSKVDLVISFGDYLLMISASPLPHCYQQSGLSYTYYLLKELKRKRPRLRPNNRKEATCLRTSKCQLMESASRLEDFIFKQSWETAIQRRNSYKWNQIAFSRAVYWDPTLRLFRFVLVLDLFCFVLPFSRIHTQPKKDWTMKKGQDCDTKHICKKAT